MSCYRSQASLLSMRSMSDRQMLWRDCANAQLAWVFTDRTCNTSKYHYRMGCLAVGLYPICMITYNIFINNTILNDNSRDRKIALFRMFQGYFIALFYYTMTHLRYLTAHHSMWSYHFYIIKVPEGTCIWYLNMFSFITKRLGRNYTHFKINQPKRLHV